MDSKAILNKIITMLGMVENKQVALGGNANAGGPFYGKLEDGSPVKTDYFDVGHTLLVVREDGSEVAAPDADHIVYLPIGLAGGFKRYFITTKDGVITSMNLEDNYNSKAVRINFTSENETQMENQTKLAEHKAKMAEHGNMEVKDEAGAVKKEEKMQEGEAARLDSLEEQLNQLRKDIASIFEEMKKGRETEMGMEINDETAKVKKMQEVDQLQGRPNYGGQGSSGQNLSAQKKFNGAPVDQKPALDGIVKTKASPTLSTVLGRLANTKL
jgi:hypothetical protein